MPLKLTHTRIKLATTLAFGASVVGGVVLTGTAEATCPNGTRLSADYQRCEPVETTTSTTTTAPTTTTLYVPPSTSTVPTTTTVVVELVPPAVVVTETPTATPIVAQPEFTG